MNEKIKWFGRYLGCSYVIYYTGSGNKTVYVDLKPYDIHVTVNHEVKLILKELKYMSDENLRELNKLPSQLKFVLDDFVVIPIEIQEFSCFQLDFLRSKGYAIGIPKEYYITQEELK